MARGVPCGLCELPCGRQASARMFEGCEIFFCCMGCANVYAILIESGAVAAGQNLRETEIFRRSLDLGLISNPESALDESAAAAFDANVPTQEAVYQIGGMWCSACGWLIERALKRLPGVVEAEVFFASDLAKVKYCPQYLPPDRIPARIVELGYRASKYAGGERQNRADLRDLLLRLGVAAFLWANIMAFSTILYVGYFEQIAASTSRILPFLLFALATPMILYCAYPILRSAAVGAANRQIRMETLLALGILTAYVLSAVQTFRGCTHVYFDTAAAIVTLVLTGKLIERGAKERAAESVGMLYRMMPKKARVESAAGESFVSIDALESGSVFIVKAGERIPADGVVAEGETHADESLLTGESSPVVKRPGDRVASGSLNAGGVIRVRALRTSEESALVQIIRQVERAMQQRAPIERTVDRISRAFVPSVVALALAAFLVPLGTHTDVAAAAMRATAVLVIACPCALGLATPLAITAAVGTASRAGLLISDSRAFEGMSRIDELVLDKTGTVTFGEFRLVDVFLPNRPGDAKEAMVAEHLAMLAGLEAWSEHPLGLAIVRFARDRGVKPVDVSGAEIRRGEGLTAVHECRRLFIGNRSLVAAEGGTLDPAAELRAFEWEQEGRTVAFFGIDNEVRGALAFGDQIKPGAAELVERFKSRGIGVHLVSGDARPTTAAVASQIGVTRFVAEATPNGKAAFIQELQRAGKTVAMVGDGINDAPALAQADLGIAMGTGADIAMSAAPVVVAGGSLAKLEEAFQLGAKTTSVVRQNLFWAFFYNLVGIPLALAGVLSPIFAAAAMLLSSVSVIANSMRLARPAAGEKEERRSSSVDIRSSRLRVDHNRV